MTLGLEILHARFLEYLKWKVNFGNDWTNFGCLRIIAMNESRKNQVKMLLLLSDHDRLGRIGVDDCRRVLRIYKLAATQ